MVANPVLVSLNSCYPKLSAHNWEDQDPFERCRFSGKWAKVEEHLGHGISAQRSNDLINSQLLCRESENKFVEAGGGGLDRAR